MQVLYGLHPVLELLRSGGTAINSILLADERRGRPAEEITLLARKQNIPIKRERRANLDRLAGGTAHQGVLAFTREFTYRSLQSIIEGDEKNPLPELLLILDSITDPQNLGSLIRSAHCFGAGAVIIPKDRAAQVTPAVIKASAGSALYMPLCQVTNIAATMDQLKDAGYWIYGADAGGEGDCRSFTFNNPTVLVMGSEGSGLRPLVRKKCDFLVHIPMKGAIDSLNVSVAGGILLYEMVKSLTLAD